MTVEITDASFAQETDKGLVLIDFWAAWCGPCRMQAPILEQLGQAYDEEDLKIAKMDVDANPATPAQFGVMSIPTLILFENGKEIKKIIGFQTEAEIKEFIK